jgi:hypothetical protein
MVCQAVNRSSASLRCPGLRCEYRAAMEAKPRFGGFNIGQNFSPFERTRIFRFSCSAFASPLGPIFSR